MKAKQSMLWNGFMMVALAVLQRGLGLISIMFLARILDASGLGSYAFVQSTCQTFYGLARIGADAGLHVLLAGTKAEDSERQSRLLSEALTVFVTIAVMGGAVVWLVARPIAGQVFGAPELAPLVPASALMFGAQVMAQYAYICFAGLHSFNSYARLTAATGLAGLVLSVAGALAYGALGAAWGAATGAVVNATFLGVGLVAEFRRRQLHIRPRLPGYSAWSMIRLGVPFYASGLLMVPVEFLCTGYLSRMFGVHALGELRVTQNMISIAAIVPSALSGPFVSQISGAESADKQVGSIKVQMKTVWILSLGMVVALGAIWPALVRIVFGPSFAAAESTGAFALLAVTPSMIVSALTGALLATRRTRPLIASSALQAGVVSIIAPMSIAWLGLAGFFGVQAIGMTVASLCLVLVLGRQFVGQFFSEWMISLSACTLLAFGVLGVSILLEIGLVGRLLLGASTAAICCYVILSHALDPEQRGALAKLVRQASLKITKV